MGQNKPGGSNSRQPVSGGDRNISCDQVALLCDIFSRYLPQNQHPRISRERIMRVYGMLYEVMEVAALKFADDDALANGTPLDVRRGL